MHQVRSLLRRHAVYHSLVIAGIAFCAGLLKLLASLKPPRWLFRTVACLVLGGQVISRICQGKEFLLRMETHCHTLHAKSFHGDRALENQAFNLRSA